MSEEEVARPPVKQESSPELSATSIADLLSGQAREDYESSNLPEIQRKGVIGQINNNLAAITLNRGLIDSQDHSEKNPRRLEKIKELEVANKVLKEELRRIRFKIGSKYKTSIYEKKIS